MSVRSRLWAANPSPQCTLTQYTSIVHSDASKSAKAILDAAFCVKAVSVKPSHKATEGIC